MPLNQWGATWHWLVTYWLEGKKRRGLFSRAPRVRESCDHREHLLDLNFVSWFFWRGITWPPLSPTSNSDAIRRVASPTRISSVNIQPRLTFPRAFYLEVSSDCLGRISGTIGGWVESDDAYLYSFQSWFWWQEEFPPSSEKDHDKKKTDSLNMFSNLNTSATNSLPGYAHSLICLKSW